MTLLASCVNGGAILETCEMVHRATEHDRTCKDDDWTLYIYAWQTLPTCSS
jgi:hypothetical protein